MKIETLVLTFLLQTFFSENQSKSEEEEDKYQFKWGLLEGLNGFNRQASKTEYFYRQPSNERAKISGQFSFLIFFNQFFFNFIIFFKFV